MKFKAIIEVELDINADSKEAAIELINKWKVFRDISGSKGSLRTINKQKLISIEKKVK